MSWMVMEKLFWKKTVGRMDSDYDVKCFGKTEKIGLEFSNIYVPNQLAPKMDGAEARTHTRPSGRAPCPDE